MKVLNFTSIWNKLTQTKALEESGGEYETAFFEPVYRVLYLTGLSSADKGLYLIYSYTVKTLIVLFVACELGFLFSMSSNVDEVIANINVTLIHLIAMYRYRSLLAHKSIFKNLSTSMERSPHFDLTTKRRRSIFEYWVKNNKRYLKLLLALGTCTLAAWYVYPLVDELDYNLVVTVRLPFQYNTPKKYIQTYILVLVAFNYASYFVMVNDLIMQSHLMHLLCQFNVLGDCFESIIEDCKKDFPGLNDNLLHLHCGFIQKYNQRLGNLVEQHQFILRNTVELKNILSVPMLYQMAASRLLICFAGYQVTATASFADVTQFLMSLLYLGYNMFELFIFCRWCDEIKIQSENIRQAVYFSGWERLAMVDGVKARLMLVIARASRPMVLTAGGVYDLSLYSYANVTGHQWAFVAMLIALHWDLIFINPVYWFVVALFGIHSTSDTMHRRINVLWRKLTQKAMEQSTGKLETAFFESVYRIVYASGLDLSDQQTVLYRIYSFITKVVIALFVSSEIWYLFGANSLDTVIENINVTTIHLLIIYRYKSMVEYKHIYHKLAKSMETPLFDISTPARKKIYEYWRRMNAKYYSTLLTLASCTLTVWYSYPLIDNVDYNLPTALKIPINYRNPEYYPITYIICTLLFHQISMFVVVNDLMIQAYLLHMICQFAVLSHCFQTVVSDCEEINGEIFRQKFLKRLGDLVAQHQFLLNNSTQLSKILNRPMLCQLLASGMLICFAGYQITTTISGSVFKFLLSLLYAAYNMYIFYVLCRWCDEIKNQSENIGTSVYHCGWEKVIAKLPEAKTRLMLIIARCNRPVVMTAGGIYDVSLMSYSSLVKTSYSTLTVLLRVRQR